MFTKKLKISLFTISVLTLFAAFIVSCGKQESTDKKDDKNQTQTQTAQNQNQNQTETPQNRTETKTDMKDMKTSDTKTSEHVMISVASMQCGTCKKNIEKSVKKVDGVIDVKVDKNEKVAHINFDKSKTNLSKIENAITSAGYDANDKKADPTAYENLDDCCKLPKDQKENSKH